MIRFGKISIRVDGNSLYPDNTQGKVWSVLPCSVCVFYASASHFNSYSNGLSPQCLLFVCCSVFCTDAQIKSVYKFATYLDVINDFEKTQCFSKLRMSAHNFKIEAGRFGKTENLDQISAVNTVFYLEYKVLEIRFILS